MSSVLRRPLPAIPQRGFSEAMQHALLVDNLLSCGNVKDAVLIDLKDFSYISANPGFEIPDAGVIKLGMLFTKPNLRSKGFTFNSNSYSVSRRDCDAVYAKTEEGGLLLLRTLKYHLVVFYDNNMFPAICAEASNKLADYLIHKGY